MPYARCRALIIEDDADASAAFQNMLALLGHSAVAVTTAAAGLALLRANTYDAVILDLVLPDDSGVTVLQEIRQRRLPVKVAVVTALYRGEQLPALTDLKPEAIFRKPVDAVALAGWVAACAGERTT
ncbi:MAG TPA: response regulator [Tepidisphaeraceae bacterium]|nr:response regulator [Tepidisphaeraceae bacterium]